MITKRLELEDQAKRKYAEIATEPGEKSKLLYRRLQNPHGLE
jgi:hypothetical protein